jgi:hypothetical protein
MKNHGPTIYFDTSLKSNGKRHNCYRADVTVRGVRYRKRGRNRAELARFLRAVSGKGAPR